MIKILAKCFHNKGQARKSESTPWYDLAKAEIGQREISGSQDNPRIVEYHQATTLKASDDETPWCASFVCWCLEVSGFKSTRSAAARSFLGWGEKIDLANAKQGDIVVFKRGSNSWSGHVAFYVSHDASSIKVLGGNQSNSVNISNYSRANLLGIRRPIA